MSNVVSPKNSSKNKADFKLNIHPETKKGIVVILFFALAGVSLLSFFSLAGSLGVFLHHYLALGFGWGKWLVPALLALVGYLILREETLEVRIVNYLGVVLFIFTFQALLQVGYLPSEMLSIDQAGLGGGLVGLILAWPAVTYLGFWASLISLASLVVIAILLTWQTTLIKLFFPVKWLAQGLLSFTRGFGEWQLHQQAKKMARPELYRQQPDLTEESTPTPQFEAKPVVKIPTAKVASKERTESDQQQLIEVRPAKLHQKKIDLPLSLLTQNNSKAAAGDVKLNQAIIQKTLENFGIISEMGEVNIGPTFTQFTLRPADGVKLSRITTLNNDLALSLAAHPIRMEAPIPGRSLVGIEVPNQTKALVGLREMLESTEFHSRKSNLSLALGKDVTGKSWFIDLARLPHLLVAGATNSGKTVCLNAIITSLLYQNGPEDLKFILIDPKKVELHSYNDIPHLITPVIMDVKKTINALKWCILEMDRRFEVLSKMGKRNIEAYNQDAAEKLPYIVVIVDELADLMAAAYSEMEALIVRLTQMARAVGIHLILATQRPSVDVITGLIKANVPARIAFSVASLVDSRTILDTSGAEKLVGCGDMLYVSAEISKPKRLQGVYLSDKEIKNMVDYLKENGSPEYVEEVTEGRGSVVNLSGGNSFGEEDGDELLPQTKEIIQQSGKASATLLQRRLKVGYARAARLLDLLEQDGFIGPGEGAKPREIHWEKFEGRPGVDNFANEEPLVAVQPEVFQEEVEEEPTIAEEVVDEEESEAEEKLAAKEDKF
ncbi:MAG: DNA translocase FtsK 4TM domain-containing protein [Candidatus Buchananbacteria bacterium]